VQFQDGFGFRVILNGTVSVDSFLIIGGILLGYLTFKELDKTNSFLNVPLFYLHRYIRLLQPIYLFSLYPSLEYLEFMPL